MHQGSITKVGVAAALVLLLASCRSTPRSGPSLGEAFVGPSVLKIRSDIPNQSSTVVTVKHGDRLEILQRRRSFLKVRAPNGAEGWTDERQLLAAEDMAALRRLHERAAKMVSQGLATTDAELRVHMQPSVKSPSLLTLKADDKVDVLAHANRPRTDLPRQPLIPAPSRKQVAAAKKPPKNQPPLPPPPMPKPPAPPANWLELSKPGSATTPAPAAQAPSPPPAVTDDWSLVRASDGQSGWVLTRRLRMAIPDEVAQYAEGHRIVSYFSLGSVHDGDQKKDIWLWTTLSSGSEPYDFDSIRVFVWSQHRHRYETQHIEKNLKGFGPVRLEDVQFSLTKGKAPASTDSYPGFSLCVEKKDGNRYRRSYALLNNSVRVAGEQPCEAPSAPLEFDQNPAPTPTAAPAQPQPESMMQRAKRRLKSLFGR